MKTKKKAVDAIPRESVRQLLRDLRARARSLRDAADALANDCTTYMDDIEKYKPKAQPAKTGVRNG